MIRSSVAFLPSIVGSLAMLACGSGQGTTSDPAGNGVGGAAPSSGGSADSASGAAALGGAAAGLGGSSTGGDFSASGGRASGDAGGGSSAVPAWCAVRGSDCAAALERCSAYSTCSADAACSAALDKLRGCMCDQERQGSVDFSACQSNIGAAGTLSGDAAACLSEATNGAASICNLSVKPGCNQLELVDPLVQELKNPLAVPKYSGGPIADGTYTLTGHSQYMAGGIGPVAQAGEWATLQIHGNTWQWVTEQEQQGGLRSTETVQVSGTSITPMQTCPSAKTLDAFSYTATDTTLTLFSGSELVFAKVAE